MCDLKPEPIQKDLVGPYQKKQRGLQFLELEFLQSYFRHSKDGTLKRLSESLITTYWV
jgi:hypothetical protein